MDTYLSDNAGRRVPPDVCAGNPTPATGVTLTDAATGGDETETVVAGGLYAFTTTCDFTNDDTFVFGVAAITTAANIVWVCPPGQTILISIPDTITTLHYMSLTSGGVGYLRRLQ